MNGYGQQYGRALATARRRARLSGRRLSTQETAGITRGFAETASQRLARAKGIELQERTITQRGELQTEQLAHMKGMQTALFGHQTGLQTRGFEFATGEREAGQTWKTGESALDRAHREQLARQQITSQESIASQQRGLQREPLGHSVCIIITACTSPKSYEVNIAREYRDTILDDITLGGYYALCQIVVPFIQKVVWFRGLVKKILVDRLVDYLEVALNYKNKTELMTSGLISKGFSSFCHAIGRHVDTEKWIELHN